MNNAHPTRMFRHRSSVRFVQASEFTCIFIHKLVVTRGCWVWMMLASEWQKCKISVFLHTRAHNLAISLFQLFLLGSCDSVFLSSSSPLEAWSKEMRFTVCCAATGYLNVQSWCSRNFVVAGKPEKQHWGQSCLRASEHAFGLPFLP